MQTPIVSKGTVFPAGTVVAIKKDHVLLDTEDGVKKFSFSPVSYTHLTLPTSDLV